VVTGLVWNYLTWGWTGGRADSKLTQITGLVWTDKQPIAQQVWGGEINFATWSTGLVWIFLYLGLDRRQGSQAK
jgi:hypothetical protein